MLDKGQLGQLVPVSASIRQLPANTHRARHKEHLHRGAVTFDTLVFDSSIGQVAAVSDYFNRHLVTEDELNSGLLADSELCRFRQMPPLVLQAGPGAGEPRDPAPAAQCPEYRAREEARQARTADWLTSQWAKVEGQGLVPPLQGLDTLGLEGGAGPLTATSLGSRSVSR
jgi:hypothetical protein